MKYTTEHLGIVKNWVARNNKGTFSVAFVEIQKGEFLGWEVTSINTMSKLKSYSHLPVYRVDDVGVLAIEPACKLAASAGHLRIIVAHKELPVKTVSKRKLLTSRSM